MTIPRIILKKILQDGELINLEGDHFHYLVRIQRLKVGEKFHLLDKIGNDFIAEIINITSKSLTAYVYLIKKTTPPDYKLSLVFSLLKSDKNDFIIKAGTQMGITDFTPIIMNRTITRPTGDKAAEKVLRLRKIAEDTARTSFLSFIPEVKEITTLHSINVESTSLKLLFSEKKGIPLLSSRENTIKMSKNITVFLGPEGGIEDSEYQILTEIKGFLPVSLGGRALKAELAFVFGLSVITYLTRGEF